MSSLTETALALFIGLVLLAAVVGVGAWIAAQVLNRRQLRAQAAGRATRAWGGKDRERVRTKYFDKERRARAQRARHRPPRGGPSAGAEPEVPGPVNLERLHGETLGLTGEATPETVRQAYKDRVREYHPDQVARLGVKLRVLAEEETKRINEAYAYFRERYGF
ncbi:MAG: J domain-containing protein [Rhodothermales bacterium]